MRTDRHIVEYQCDNCPQRVVAYDGYGCPTGPMPPLPEGWSKRFGKSSLHDVHLCSTACLQAWAGKQGGEGG